jgi:large subunit ribosomal protein L15
MTSAIQQLKPAQGAVKKRFKKGRGISSGSGKTSGRGHRGQKCRSGYSSHGRREGGQTPMYRRLPKRQLNSRVNRKEYVILSLNDLQDLADINITTIDLPLLLEEGLVKKSTKWGLKVLADGELNSAVTVQAAAFSASAKEAIEKAGGKAELVIE